MYDRQVQQHQDGQAHQQQGYLGWHQHQFCCSAKKSCDVAFFLVAHYLIFSHNQPFRLGRGGCTWQGGDAQGGLGGCTCILCIPPGYATARTSGTRTRLLRDQTFSFGEREWMVIMV
jgi:hypothetical protein